MDRKCFNGATSSQKWIDQSLRGVLKIKNTVKRLDFIKSAWYNNKAVYRDVNSIVSSKIRLERICLKKAEHITDKLMRGETK